MTGERQHAADLCERCHRDVNGTPHLAMCGHPLQSITDAELADLRSGYEEGLTAAKGYVVVARLLNEIDQLRAREAAVEGAWRCWHCGSEHGPVLCTACVDRVVEKARAAERDEVVSGNGSDQ